MKGLTFTYNQEEFEIISEPLPVVMATRTGIETYENLTYFQVITRHRIEQYIRIFNIDDINTLGGKLK